MSGFGTPYDRALRGYFREGGSYGSTYDRAHRGYLVGALYAVYLRLTSSIQTVLELTSRIGKV